MTQTLQKTFRKWSLLAFTALLSLFGGTLAAQAADGFYVENGRVFDARGNEFIMRGVSYPHVWFPQNTAQAIPDIAAKGANCVRVVLTSGHRGYWGISSAQDVADVIQLCRDNNLIAILEVHDTTGFGENPDAATIAEAVDYWISIKDVLVGEEDYVIINLGNEPFGNSNIGSTPLAQAWTDAHIDAIARLRNEGFTHTLLIDAPYWGQDWGTAMPANAPSVFAADPLANVVFSVHMYQVYGSPTTVENYLQNFVALNLPIIVGEFGHEHQGEDVAEAAVMRVCNQLGLGYIGWSWSGNGDGAEPLDMVFDFNANNLTPWGEIFFNAPNGLSTTSEIATVFGADAPPAVAASASTVTLGDIATLSVTSTEDPNATFQWQRMDGTWTNIPGATANEYSIPSTQRFHSGDYRVIAYTNTVPATSGSIQVNVQAPIPSNSRLLSLSTRALSLTGDNVLIPGFVIQGTGTKRLLIRAVGPTLGNAPFGLAGVLSDPTMTLNQWNGTGWDVVDANDNWGDNANQAEITQTAANLFAFALSDALDAALLVDLPTGQYTVVSSGVNDVTGIAIVELYDADTVSTASMTSISNRGWVGIGNDVMIPGFVVSNEGPKTFLIRVVGPTLGTDFGVQGTMDDPQLTVFRREQNGSETNLLSNDNWEDNPDSAYTEQISAQVFAFPLGTDSNDAAIVATLEPGIYSVVGSAADGISTGVVIVEVYVVE